MRRDHFFDWNGFKFAAKVIVLAVIAGTLGRYGLLYAAQSRSGEPSLILIQEMRPAQRSLSLTLSTTTSKHVIDTLAISDAVPPSGKLIAADLSKLVLTLYEDGAAVAKYPIQSGGREGSRYRPPPGFYTVLAKESDHYNAAERVDLPWSVRFYGNYFIHGLPYSASGSPLPTPGSASIELSSEDAKGVYEFAEAGAPIFVFDPLPDPPPSLTLDAIPAPVVSAASYLVADIDTGDVFLEEGVGRILPIGSATKFMTALATNEMLSVDAKDNASSTSRTRGLLDWMNARAKALDMSSTRFRDLVGTSTKNVSTADDMFRLAAYLTERKSFILNESAARDPVLSVISMPIHGVERRIAIIALRSDNAAADLQKLTDWFTQSALQGADFTNTACVSCGPLAPYRKIQF